MMERIVLLGPPGTGKGTQADLLSKREGFIHLSTGDLLRGEIAGKTEFGKKIKNFLDNGLLVPDEMITDYIIGYIEKNALYNKRVLFDGFPRRIAQAEALDDCMKNRNSSVECAILIALEDDIIVSRLSNRMICSGCKKIYPGTCEEEYCIECHQKLVKRSDDNIDVIRKRLDVYKNETAELIGYYKNLSKLIEIDGSRDFDEVFKNIKKALGV